MSRFQSQLNQKDDVFIHPPPTPPNYEKTSSSSVGRNISPVLLLIIAIFAIIIFIAGLVLLLFLFFKKKTLSPSILFNSNRYTDTSGSHAIQRQLQQLFRLQDSGLDQASVDELPVFNYKDIMGLKEPFDCAVCLCAFSGHDKLRLLPICSHAFHINCIDTWLLSNSTCPLCRGTLLSSGLSMQIPAFDFDDSLEISNGCLSDGENGLSCGQKEVIKESAAGEKRVFFVRLGKFRSLNNDGGADGECGHGEASSGYKLDARRCYSMGSFQYVVGDSYLQVALSPDDTGDVNFARGRNGSSSGNGDVEGKKISSWTRSGESFSVSKIWLWSKKSKLPSYSASNYMDVVISSS